MIKKYTAATQRIPSPEDNFLLADQTEHRPADRTRIARAMLSALREQEIAKLKELIRQEVSQEASGPGDESDSALLQEGIELHASLIDLSESRLTAIWAALDRLEENRYGICERCGDEIPFTRLRAMPMSVHCVDCQAKVEAARNWKPAGRDAALQDTAINVVWTDDFEPAPRARGRGRERSR